MLFVPYLVIFFVPVLVSEELFQSCVNFSDVTFEEMSGLLDD